MADLAVLLASAAKWPVTVPVGGPAAPAKVADLTGFAKYAFAKSKGGNGVLAHANLLKASAVGTIEVGSAALELVEALADLQVYGSPQSLASAIALGNWGFVGNKWADLDVAKGQLGQLTTPQLVRLLMRRIALAIFTDGFWGTWSLEALPEHEQAALLSNNAASYSGQLASDDAFVLGLAGLRPVPCAPWSLVPAQRNAQNLFEVGVPGTYSKYDTGVLWDVNPIFNFWEALQVVKYQAPTGFFGPPWTPAQACVGVSDWMRRQDWVHGRQNDVVQWFNQISQVNATPLSGAVDNDIFCRFEHLLYRKIGNCHCNSAYLQTVLRTMNLVTVMHSVPILDTSSSEAEVDGEPRVYTFSMNVELLHSGVTCLTAGRTLVHGDHAIADFGRFASSSAAMWLNTEHAALLWLGLSAQMGGKYQDHAIYTTLLACAAIQKSQAGLLPDSGAQVAAWGCAAFGTTSFMGASPSAQPNSPWFNSSLSGSLGYFAWTLDLLYGNGNSGESAGFGLMKAKDGTSTTAVAEDWSLDPKTFRRRAVVTRAFACAVAPSVGVFQAGMVTVTSWAVVTLLSVLGAAILGLPTTPMLDLQIRRFFRLDVATGGTAPYAASSWYSRVWPTAIFNTFSLGSPDAKLGGVLGDWPGNPVAPDMPQIFPSCQAYRILPTTAATVTGATGAELKVRRFQWDDPSVRTAIIQFAAASVNWAMKIA